MFLYVIKVGELSRVYDGNQYVDVAAEDAPTTAQPQKIEDVQVDALQAALVGADCVHLTGHTCPDCHSAPAEFPADVGQVLASVPVEMFCWNCGGIYEFTVGRCD